MTLRFPVMKNRKLFAGLAFVTALGACDAPFDGAVLVDPLIEEPVIVAEASVVLESPAEAAVITKPLPSRSTRTPRRGVLTAGDIDDGLNLAAFARFQRSTGKQLKLRGANLSRPILARLVGADGTPQAGVRFSLRKPGASKSFYEGYSGVDGVVTVFPAALGAGTSSSVELRAFPDNAGPVAQRLTAGSTRQTVQVGATQGWQPDFMDLAFVIDTSGSMGDEMEWLAKELKSIVRQAKRVSPGVDVRVGLVAYKSLGDEYTVRNFGFTKDLGQFRRWLNGERPSGGSGSAEYVARALKSAVNLDWRRGKGERLLFQIGDEPPERDQTMTYLNASAEASRKGIQIFGLGASGVETHLEYLMRQGAVVSGGRYLFLTDDSGVGFAHAEPSVSCYRVSTLNDLMVRVLKSELSGTRVEAKPGSVIRQVGSYRRGVCLN